MSAVQATIAEHRIHTPDGDLHACEWRPREDDGGTPLLLLHDSLGCIATWRDFPLQLCLASRRRVFAYDRLGFGRSDPNPEPLTLDFMREEAARFFPHVFEQLELQHVIPLGHSAGGAMAMHGGVLLPGVCNAIITEAAQVFAETLTLESIMEAKRSYEDPAQLARLEKYHGAKSTWVLRAWTDTWLHPRFAFWSLVDTLPMLRCPILAIHGDQDEFGSLAHPELIQKRSSGPVEVMIMKDTGHVPHRAQPAAVIERICGFLDRSVI